MPLKLEQINDTILSPRLLTAGAILKVCGWEISFQLPFLVKNRAENAGTVGSTRSNGTELRQINFPNGSVIGAVVREEKVIIPDGSS